MYAGPLFNLVRGCQSGIDIGFLSFGAHLLRCSEYAAAELLVENYLHVCGDVGHILEVGLSASTFARPSSSITSLRAVLTIVAPFGILLSRS